MRYALLICDEEKRQAEMSEDEAAAQMAAYMAFGEEMGARGVLQGGERLQPDDRDDRAGPRRRGASRPTARSPRPRSRSAASTSSTARTSTRPSRSRRRSPAPATARSRCGRSGRCRAGPDVEAAVAACVPGGVGPRRRDPDPGHRRLGPRRGVRAGRLRPGARALAARRHPARPGAWLTTTARNRALDRLRREQSGAAKLQEVAMLSPTDAGAPAGATRAASTTTGCG